ncbi:T9SS type B sorting domain-containing protein [Hyunsoonleella ulvae]|uniref:T9SS type B sorting domain-containing protein n=1 Tax=Hyunsoonleella ulvae TaxID=2799948 RepID=UPI00193A645D|nr:T9SS type B sorting domain-containing protein [Hyunsoonleella ulvae]
MKKNTVFLLLWMFALNLYSQRQAANWYFGNNAGLTFNVDGSISELTDGMLSTNEGCTTISDINGNLLFYTDGITVWDRLHRPMPNANPASGGLFGDPSSTQSAIVIPKPNDDNIYYIFTVDTTGPNDPIDFGFNYSTVDMRLNGGFGDVVPTSKNINLRSDSSEKISAVVKDCESKELWVITFGPSTRIINDVIFHDTFYAYEITDTGINTTPVISSFPSLEITDPRGYLKLSPDGTKVACANVTSGLFLFDFDVNTGQVTNQSRITVDTSLPSKPQSPYGLEFSQNNELLYVTAYYDAPDPIEFNTPSAQYTSLIQYDLTVPNVSASAVIIDERIGFRGGLQLGIDGRIYRAMSRTFSQGLPNLSVVNAPNTRGLSCDYQHNKIALSRNSTQGLPPFITSFFTQKIDIIGNNASSTDLKLCEGERFVLRAPDFLGATYTWTRNGNNLTNSGNTYEVRNNLDGLYSVLIDLNTGRCEDRFEGAARVSFSPNPIASDTSLLQCDEDGIPDGLTVFNLEEATETLTNNNTELGIRYYTDPARTTAIVDPSRYPNTSNNQIIYVEVYNPDTLCSVNAELTLTVSTTSIVNTGITKCDDDGNEDGFYAFNLSEAGKNIISGLPSDLIVSYYETYEDALLEQNDLLENYINTQPFVQTIFVRAENENNCYGISELELIVNPLPTIQDTFSTYYCINLFPDPISINADIPLADQNNYTYLWSTGETTHDININSTGIYTVDITSVTTECTSTRTVTVEPSSDAAFVQPNPFTVSDATSNNTVAVNVTGDGIYQYRLVDTEGNFEYPFQDSNVFDNVKGGIYTVFVKDIKNNCGTVQSKVSVISFPKFFTPNNDGKNDTWQVYGVSEMFQPNTKIMIFNRYGKLLKEITPLGEGWDGILNGQILPADDYWFSVILQDGRVFKDHFTLKN